MLGARDKHTVVITSSSFILLFCPRSLIGWLVEVAMSDREPRKRRRPRQTAGAWRGPRLAAAIAAAGGIWAGRQRGGGPGATGPVVRPNPGGAWPLPAAEAASASASSSPPPYPSQTQSQSQSQDRSIQRLSDFDAYLDAEVGKGGGAGSARSGAASDGGGGVIVVATVGGTLAGISRSSGRMLWKRSAPASAEDGPTDADADSEVGESDVPRAAGSALFAPLVSTSTTAQRGSAGLADGERWRTTAVPSVDGRVYLTDGSSSASASSSAASAPEPVVATARELVGRAPFVDARGRFYVGSRAATVAALDRDTGEILRVVGGGDEAALPKNASLLGRNVVWLGRTDYSISVFDARTGDVDVKFSTSDVLSVGDMLPHGDGRGSVEAPRGGGGGGVLGGQSDALLTLSGEMGVEALAGYGPSIGDVGVNVDGSIGPSSVLPSTSFPLLVATPSGSLALRDPTTGRLAWVSDATFETPVAFAVDSNRGESIGVDIVPDAAVPGEDSEFVKEELERQLAQMEDQHGVGGGDDQGTEGDAGKDETLVGRLPESGQLYAMPLGTASKVHGPLGMRQGLLPGLPHAHGHGAGPASSRRIGHLDPRHYPQAISAGDKGDRHYPPHHQSQGPGTGASVSTSTSLARINDHCNVAHANFPACLVGSHLKQGHDYTEYRGSAGGGTFLDQNGPHDSQADATVKALIMAGQMYYDQLGPDLLDAAQQGGWGRNQRRSGFKDFMRIMSSWVPPAVALIFVVSFEFGRRERLRAEKEVHDKARADDEGSAVSLTKAQVADGQIVSGSSDTGVIKVTDTVLGYGGHGTVVYHGTLDGRAVAVKRMLKAYHASAIREISLLIDADGHPNVVRYFLKEVRGDFVYLALELCDMSLHDLIVAIGEHRYWNKFHSKLGYDQDGDKDEGKITKATRDTLNKIACGVKHLHSLRIVHRDLKPQNILLAHRNQSKSGGGFKHLGSSNTDARGTATRSKDEASESIYESFDRGEFVPKISDMGLGKQLLGQSSFGFSTVGNASAGLLAAGGHSKDVVGAGPGSVGWQAPEVMSLRRSPEMRSGSGSSNLIEASPLEGSTDSIRTSRSVDIFSLGCIFYCTIIPGSHPFGEWYEREANIMKYEPNLEGLEDISVDAFHLVKGMIAREPKMRPTASQVCRHPLFWDTAKRMAFLCEISDRLEATAPTLVDEDGTTGIRASIREQYDIDPFLVERNGSVVIGTSWDKELDKGLLNNVSKFRTYDPSSVRDFLRLIRNKYHHFDELPDEVKAKVGQNPTALVNYFERKFPRLVMHCYHVCQTNLSEGDALVLKYHIPINRRGKSIKEVEAPRTIGEAKTYLVTRSVSDDSSVLASPESRTSEATEAITAINSAPVVTGDLRTKEDYLAQETSSSKGGEWNTKNVVGSLPNIAHLSTVDENDMVESKEAVIQVEELQPNCEDANTNGRLRQVPTVPVEVQNLVEIPTFSPSEAEGMVVWEGSTAARSFNCRGWYRSDDEWRRKVDSTLRKRDANVARCATDPKFRTRLCNHWDVSLGTRCPMRKKKKCIFAHGPVELRVKKGKKNRWGKLVCEEGNCSNPQASGGEDTYGAARSIEQMREKEGKWNANNLTPNKTGRYRGKQNGGNGHKKGRKS